MRVSVRWRQKGSGNRAGATRNVHPRPAPTGCLSQIWKGHAAWKTVSAPLLENGGNTTKRKEGGLGGKVPAPSLCPHPPPVPEL